LARYFWVYEQGQSSPRDFNRVYYSLKMPEQSKPKPTSGYERIYQELSPEEQDITISEFKKIQAAEKLLKEKPASPKVQ
jgi:hypothetical protein